MRIATVIKDRCHPKRCNQECIAYCPRVRAGDETVTIGPLGKAVISEELCVGCGICVHKCPFDAIRIINLPEELRDEILHQYGVNGFRLYRLPTPVNGKVVGILGANGIGKTTVINILSGQFIPNMGNLTDEPSWDNVIKRFAGTEMHDYLKRLAAGEITAALKPQYVDKLPKVIKGNVGELLRKVDTRGRMDAVVEELEIGQTLKKELSELSGGELQRVSIAATLLKDADIYFFDEPSSYLDIYQRLKVSEIIQELSKEKNVMVIEHDLAILDSVADNVHLMYGSEGSYGIVAQPRPVRTAINVYLTGFLKEENIRFRERAIEFDTHPARGELHALELLSYPELVKKMGSFTLKVNAGSIKIGEVVGVVGPNAIGKTTFVKMLAGVIEPDSGELEGGVKVSYKPQYIKPDFDGSVRELLYTMLGPTVQDTFFISEISHPLTLKNLMDKDVMGLSGGELQRVSLAVCLGREADIYLIDEPSAYLDANQRMEAAKTIRRVMEKTGRSGIIVDHDVYFIDLVSDSIMVFEGEPGIRGESFGPLDLREGMNRFLKGVGITFRRDNDTRRPRINKRGSRLDREQKSSGEYYYEVVG